MNMRRVLCCAFLLLFSLLALTWPAAGRPAQAAAGTIRFREFPIPTANSGAFGITAGPDGKVWFVEVDANKIARITHGGTITEFPIPTANSQSFGITAGPDGAIWFTESAVNKI